MYAFGWVLRGMTQPRTHSEPAVPNTVAAGAADIERLRAEYARRKLSPTVDSRDSLFNDGNLFTVQQRQRAMLHLLRKYGFNPLSGKRILEVGCGSGFVLHELLGIGAQADLLCGVDLLPERISAASKRLPTVSLAQADGQQLPFESGSFNLALQFTAFSSVLDPAIKRNLAGEMMRVLRADGLII